MKRRNFISSACGALSLSALSGGCSFMGALPDSRGLVDTPARRAAYLARMLKELCTDLGPHPVGSPTFQRAAKIVRREMAHALPSAMHDPFTFERWVLNGKPELTVGGKKLETFPAHGTSGTPPEGIKGIVRKIEDDGGIPYGVFDRDTGKLVAYITTGRYELAVPLPYYSYKKTVRSLPTFNVGRVDVPVIDKAVAESAPVWLFAQVEFLPGTKTSNVVGTLPGESAEELVFLAHLDTVYNSPGANDNTASVIVMLMIAHAFSGRRPKKTLTFVATEGEEYDKLGAINYAERRKREGTFENIDYIVNFDSLTWGQNLQIYSRDRELMAMIEGIDRDLGLPGTPVLFETDDFKLDARPFRETGARAMYVNSRGYENTRVWHRPEDTVDTVPVECAELGYRMFVELTRRICEL